MSRDTRKWYELLEELDEQKREEVYRVLEGIENDMLRTMDNVFLLVVRASIEETREARQA